ncbi:hypothetical protein Tsubulata_031003 [Turnera subulata]|uniref:DRBM domain-containing protein n=1 Tax=Turnera subulata TaxID=218843 RepID=A0A9Q0JKX8_9ROSI|nr:hypothetical protein Tsubulata_031003 [Turnera subulata]
MEKKSPDPQNPDDTNLHHFPPLHQATSNSQGKRGKPKVMPYVPKNIGTRTEEGKKRMKQFDEEANTKADLLEEIKLVCNIKSEDVDDPSVPSVKCVVEPNNILQVNDSVTKTFPAAGSSGEPCVSAKSILLETCAVKKWKPPLFECEEGGPCHRKLYTVRVIVEIVEAPSTVLECLSAPWPKKKRAAEHAAEGALWYLKNSGYLPRKKLKK